jgi:hypothetical protein
MRIIKNTILLVVILNICSPAQSQSGESQFKTVIINQNEKRIVDGASPTALIPRLRWTMPELNNQIVTFPVYEISGIVWSPARLQGLTLYINGRIPDDNKTFLIVPTENDLEYKITRSITLSEGINELKLEAKNETGTGASEIMSINFTIPKIDDTYTEKRLALVIGNSNYIHASYLQNPVNDANSIAQALTEVGFTVIKYTNADQKTLKKAMDDFGEKLKNFNVGLFYYAGHGIQAKGVNYLIPVDAELKVEQDVEYDCADAGRILGKMEAAGTKTNIVILDACRNNPFERAWGGRTAGQGTGLAFMNAPSGSLIAYATSPGKTASDGTGRNGLYTEAILKYIKVPGMPIEEFFKNVRTLVENNSNREQTPWESTSLKGNFYFKIK